ncbi:DUF485 domain-containing protein [Edaphobacillus lindanitolerans]|uniref:Uncharacterized membrane protein, DUF485 family n=1 Tax=Edaphobacillus lindanitolerans TaxID=550447 RepID=A0A1U7PKG2_9BACI|nr:DUF485 domain-containing protein [Edaphobacillus lindanitolerans]SIT71048.1 Uncharacterized membrane protein, DUF485 family [Edaphobacillus lindanitolerans]
MKVGSVYTEKRTAGKGREQAVPERLGGTDFTGVAEGPKFKALMSRKKKFIVPLTVFFLAFYFMLPILTSYTNVLEQPAIGDISWAWLYATAQFIMTWVLCIVYVKKFHKFDSEAEDIVETELKGDHRP